MSETVTFENAENNSRIFKTNKKHSHVEYYYHIGMDSDRASQFSDVKTVILMGKRARAKKTAHMYTELTGVPCRKWGDDDSAYELWRAGSVLFCSHGMGGTPFSVILHEITKMLWAAGATGFSYIRLGTSGGIGLEPGEIVLTDQALDDRLRPYFEQVCCLKVRKVSTHMDAELRETILRANRKVKIVVGKTVGCDGFYENQGRLDGAICGYGAKDRENFVQCCAKKGVANIEMECHRFSAFCNDAGIPGACLCLVIVNRLNGDQITSTAEQLATFENEAIMAVLRYAKHVNITQGVLSVL